MSNLREQLQAYAMLEWHMTGNWGRPDLVPFAQEAINLVNSGQSMNRVAVRSDNTLWVYTNEYGEVSALQFVEHFRLEDWINEEVWEC